MTVVTTFWEKRQEKQWKFERHMLGGLSLEQLKEDAKKHFSPLFPMPVACSPYFLDPCVDTAIDAYLLGAEYSRFGYYGEKSDQVKKRCERELNEIFYLLFDLLHPWYDYHHLTAESLVIAVQYFVERWWEKGFLEGKKHHKLRLL